MRKIIIIMAICLSIVSPLATAQPEIQDIQHTVSAPVSEAGKISLDLKGMDIVEVIKMLATKGNMNIVVGTNVKGRVTIFLKDVDIADAFEIILVANDLAFDKRGGIIYVMTQRDYEVLYGEKYGDKKEVKIIQLKYAKAVEIAKALNLVKTKIGKIIVDEGSNTIVVIDSPATIAQISDMIEKIDMPTATKIFELKYAKAADLKTKVSEMLTKGVGTMQIDERTNKIAVTDLEKKIAELDEVIAAFDDKLQQVLIESKIVQITLDDKYKLGVDWQQVIKKLEKEINVKSTFEMATINTFTPGAQVVIGTLGGDGDYAAMIQALKTIGDTNLLSSPRITALNNQEAKILVGTSQPYATNVVTQGTSTTTTGTTLNFLDVGVKLYVTPNVNKDGFITMKIKPEVSSVSGTYTYGSPATTVPIVSTTQAETSVTVKDGTTIIIAGLIKDERTSTVDKVPILGDIPIIGTAFRKTNKEVKKEELVVFLTPHIITGETDYLEQPRTVPIGEKKFTTPEKPAFERRDETAMKPGYFKEKRGRPADAKKMEAPSKEKMTQIMEAATYATLEEYYSAVKGRIVENVELPKMVKGTPLKGEVKVVFSLSSNGDLVYGPAVLRSSNPKMEELIVAAVKKAAPFPAFSGLLNQPEKRFVIEIAFE